MIDSKELADIIRDHVARALAEHDKRSKAGGLDVELLGDEIGTLIVEQTAKRLKAVTDRLDALEGARSMTFEGGFDPGKTPYRAGAVVQKSSGLFVALTETKETPGASDHWRRIGASA